MNWINTDFEPNPIPDFTRFHLRYPSDWFKVAEIASNLRFSPLAMLVEYSKGTCQKNLRNRWKMSVRKIVDWVIYNDRWTTPRVKITIFYPYYGGLKNERKSYANTRADSIRISLLLFFVFFPIFYTSFLSLCVWHVKIFKKISREIARTWRPKLPIKIRRCPSKYLWGDVSVKLFHKNSLQCHFQNVAHWILCDSCKNDIVYIKVELLNFSVVLKAPFICDATHKPFSGCIIIKLWC